MKKIISMILMSIICISFTACIFDEQVKEITPQASQMKSICELATMECYYHNVAKSTKTKGTGLTHVGEKERKFWIE